MTKKQKVAQEPKKTNMSHFKLPKSIKALIAGDKYSNQSQLTALKQNMISAQLNTSDRMMMLYDVSPDGRLPKKAKVKPEDNTAGKMI